jgi:hypothetical protein
MGYIGKQPASAPLTSSDIADGIISEAKIGANAVTTGKIADGTISSSDTDGSIGSPAFKNLIINGDMSQAQRGTSTSSVSSGSTFPTDRFKFMPNALGTFTISQSTTVPSGQGFAKSIKVDCTTANASAVQFWLATGANYNNQTLSTSWSSVTQASRVSSSQVNIADNTANEWYITGLQMEVGTTASDFEFLPIDVNERRCFRYFQDMAGFVMWTTFIDGNTSTRGAGHFVFNTPMRATPSASKTNNAGTIDSQTITTKSYHVMAEANNRGTTTHVTDIELDAEL